MSGQTPMYARRTWSSASSATGKAGTVSASISSTTRSPWTTTAPCLDLGPSDAVFTRGWDSKVELSGDEAKAMKREIDTQWICLSGRGR